MTTLKQKLAIANVIENHGNISKAMLKAGYTPASAKNPKNLTESKAWNELVEQYLPDDKLLSKHEEALEATKWNDFTGEREEDHITRLKAVELGYKLKRRLGSEILQQFNTEGGSTYIIQVTKDEKEFNNLASQSEQDIFKSRQE